MSVVKDIERVRNRAASLVEKMADDNGSRKGRDIYDIQSDILGNLALGGLGSTVSVLGMYGGVPVTRAFISGDPFPRYRKPTGEVGQTALWKDLLRQTIGSIVGLPTNILIRMLPMLVTKHLSSETEASKNPLLVALSSLLSGAANTALIDPLTRYFEYGSAYPTYLTSDNKEVKHRVLHDLLYGLSYSAPEALVNAYVVPSLTDLEKEMNAELKQQLKDQIRDLDKAIDKLREKSIQQAREILYGQR